MPSIISSLGRTLTNPYNIAAGVGTVASGGGLAALLPLLGRAGLGAGVDYMQQGRQEEFNKRQREAQARANLMQAVSPRGQRFEAPVDVPKAGVLEKLGTAAQTGLSVADAFRTAKTAAEAARDAKALRALTLQEKETARDVAAGQQESRALGVQSGEAAARGARPTGPLGWSLPGAEFQSTAEPGSTQAQAFRADQKQAALERDLREYRRSFDLAGLTGEAGPDLTGGAPTQTIAGKRFGLEETASERDQKRLELEKERLELEKTKRTAKVREDEVELMNDQRKMEGMLRAVMANPGNFERYGQNEQGAFLSLLALSDAPEAADLLATISGVTIDTRTQEGLDAGKNAIRLMDRLDVLIRQEEEGILGGIGFIDTFFNLPGGESSKRIKDIEGILSQLAPQVFKMNQSGVMSETDFAFVMQGLPDINVLLSSDSGEIAKLEAAKIRLKTSFLD